MSAISDDMLQNIFKYMNQRQQNNRNSNNNDNNKYPIGEELIFGEELDGYFESFENVHHAVYEKDVLYPVKEMTRKITMEFYEGEPKHVDNVAGIYAEIVKARLTKGLKGMKGFNMKGIIVAILYMVISFEFKSRLDVKTLLKASNKVRSSTTTKITSKMVFRYIKIILDNIKQYNANLSNSNNENNNRSIEQELKRIGIKVGYTTKEIFTIKKQLAKITPTIKKSHHPHSLAGAVMFVYMTEINNMNKKSSESKIGLSKYAINTVVPKIRKLLVATNRIPVSVIRTSSI